MVGVGCYRDWGKVGKLPKLLPRQHGTVGRILSNVEAEQSRVAVGYNFC